MSGKNSGRKPYTLSEMKAIVDYLTEHKAYSEVKARKMWIDMQDSKITNRTWQSLKETFLKRILPDIHNPYYKLSLQQIASFKQGCDIQKKLNNKLQLRATTPDSNTDGENKKSDDSESNKSKDVTGEELKPSISNLRDSTETLILENIEDIAEKNQNTAKGLKNLDTYSEPLKSMIEAVINDFTIDGSNDEPQMQIVEAIDNNQSEAEDPPEVISKPSQKCSNDELYNILNGSNEMTTNETKEVNVSSQVLDVCELSSENEGESKDPKKKASKTHTNNSITENSISLSKTSNNTNLTPDTLLPGNQEYFKKKLSVTDTSNTFSETNHRKRRATSQDHSVGTSNGKKRSLNKNKQSISDMEINTNDKEKVDLRKFKKQKIQEVVESSIAKSTNGVNQELLKDNDTNNTSLIIDEKSSPEFENACFQSRDADPITPNVENNVKEKLHDKSANDNREKEETVNNIREIGNERVMMKSHSESLSNSTKEAEQRRSNSGPQQHRDWALTNMFGFTSGAVNRNRKRKKSFRRFSSSRNQNLNISTDSSAWTSDTGSEYISPPRERKNKHSRKYLKPNSGRVLSLEEEGGLFVMYGKKIYPVVKDGKIIKNYVNFIREDDVDNAESFWKLKYVEEKKKTQELTKLIKQVIEKNDQESRLSVPTTSVHISSDDDQKKSDRNQKTKSRSSDNITAAKQADENEAVVVDHKEVPVPEKDTVKIKFTVKNEEVELEGRSTLVNPLLAQVVQLLQNETSSEKLTPKSGSVSSEKSSVAVASDQEAKERVNNLENEIFKEIVERDHGDKPHSGDVNKKSNANEKDVTPDINVVPPNEKQTEQNESEGTPSENVTKRAGRMKRSSLVTPVKQTPVKKPESDKESITRRSTRTGKSLNTDNEDGDSNTTKTRRSTAKKSLSDKSMMVDDDSQVKYKFPPPAQTAAAKENKKGMKSKKYQRKTKR